MDTPLHPKYNLHDISYDTIYPEWIRALSRMHWTPIDIAKEAADFLAFKPGTKVLDIGSGSGKFCMIAAALCRKAEFYGVEQRRSLHLQALQAKEKMGLENAFFINDNFTRLDFEMFDSFYFYNSFYENLDTTDKIDETLQYSKSLYDYYTCFLNRELDKKPKGTRLVTYHSDGKEVPFSYKLIDGYFHPELKMWKKI